MQEDFQPAAGWSEQNSRTFIDFGRYVVPDRELQLQTFCDLIPPRDRPFHILELGCGEGLLAAALLERFPQCRLHALDGSPEMLRAARARLGHYGERVTLEQFDLASPAWRHPAWPLHAVVSSLVIHHLDAQQKQELFRDVYRMLAPDGVLVIADLVQPAHPLGTAVAARAWDDAVRQRSLEIDGNTAAFDFFSREEWNYYRYPDPLDKPSGLFEQLKWLEAAGFVDVDVYWMKAGHTIFGGRKAGD